jgi:hypothetical protein
LKRSPSLLRKLVASTSYSKWDGAIALHPFFCQSPLNVQSYLILQENIVSWSRSMWFHWIDIENCKFLEAVGKECWRNDRDLRLAWSRSAASNATRRLHIDQHSCTCQSAYVLKLFRAIKELIIGGSNRCLLQWHQPVIVLLAPTERYFRP